MGAVTYAKLSDLLDTSNASITTIFRQKGSTWSSGWHNGIDIAAAQGVAIKAAADGVVVNADTVAHNDGFGNRVIILHADGKATLYAHQVATPPVKVGQTVKKGQVIGNVGNTGLSYGAHLHFTIIDNYEKNPNIYYKGDLLDPILICGLGSMKFSSSCGSTVVLPNGTAKNLGDLNKYYSNSGSSGQTVIPNNPTPKADSPTTGFKIGDIVHFKGGLHYVSSTAKEATGGTRTAGAARIANIAQGAAHPYSLVGIAGGSNVYGWVDENTIGNESISVGDKVKVNSGAKTYTGDNLASFVYNNTYTVMEIGCGVAPDYIVIGDGKAITAAVKASDLTKA